MRYELDRIAIETSAVQDLRLVAASTGILEQRTGRDAQSRAETGLANPRLERKRRERYPSMIIAATSAAKASKKSTEGTHDGLRSQPAT